MVLGRGGPWLLRFFGGPGYWYQTSVKPLDNAIGNLQAYCWRRSIAPVVHPVIPARVPGPRARLDMPGSYSLSIRL